MRFYFDTSHIFVFLSGVFLAFGIMHADRILNEVRITSISVENYSSSVAAASFPTVIEKETLLSPPAGAFTQPPPQSLSQLFQEPLLQSLLFYTDLASRPEEVPQTVSSTEIEEGEEDALAVIEEDTEKTKEVPEEKLLAGSLNIPQLQKFDVEPEIIVAEPETAIIEDSTPSVTYNAADIERQIAEAIKSSETLLAQVTKITDSGGESGTLPEGVYQLPSGQYVDVNGNFISGDPTVGGYYIPTSRTQERFTTPAGVVTDARGNILSVPKVERNLPDPTVIDLSSLPEYGSTIYIPNYVSSRVTQNQFITCTQHKFFDNDLALCELYKSGKDKYAWEVIHYE